MSPFFSIIMPTFNYGHFIGDSILSVLKQEFKDWELIIVDNFSVDNTKEIVQGFDDPRIKYFEFANGGSIAKARNFGLSKSTGVFGSFLDSDDLWHPLKLLKVQELVSANKDACFVFHDSFKFKDKFDFNLYPLENKMGKKIQKPYFNVINDNPVKCLTAVVRLEILREIGLFDEDLAIRGNEDWDLWIRISAGYDFHFIPLKLGAYRIHDSGFSKKTDAMIKASETVFAKHITNNSNLSHKQKQQALYYHYKRCADYISYSKDLERLRSIFMTPFLINPLRWSYYFFRCYLRAV